MCTRLVAQLCPTLCDPMDCSPPGSSVHGTLQARILEWAAFTSPQHLPDPGIKPGSLALQGDSLPSELSGRPENDSNTHQNHNSGPCEVELREFSLCGSLDISVMDFDFSMSRIKKRI